MYFLTQRLSEPLTPKNILSVCPQLSLFVPPSGVRRMTQYQRTDAISTSKFCRRTVPEIVRFPVHWPLLP